MAINGPCGIKVSLLSNLSSASLAHAQQSALLSAHAASSDHDGFAEAMKICGQTQASYEAAWKALKAHLVKHGC
jgi:hypothetical protein